MRKWLLYILMHINIYHTSHEKIRPSFLCLYDYIKIPLGICKTYSIIQYSWKRPIYIDSHFILSAWSFPYTIFQIISYNVISMKRQLYKCIWMCRWLLRVEDEGLESQPVSQYFCVMPATMLKKITAGSGPASKTKSQYIPIEPPTDKGIQFMFHAIHQSIFQYDQYFIF